MPQHYHETFFFIHFCDLSHDSFPDFYDFYTIIALIDLFYFNNDYQEDREAFYQTLHHQFDNFLNNLNKIIKTSGMKE